MDSYRRASEVAEHQADHRSLRTGLTALVRELSDLDELAPPQLSRISAPGAAVGRGRPARAARTGARRLADGAVVILRGKPGMHKPNWQPNTPTSRRTSTT
jgi:hypothetical protein